MDPHAILDAAIALVEKANRIGLAAEVALKAFRERLSSEPVADGMFRGQPAVYGSLDPAAQEAVDEAVEACQVD